MLISKTCEVALKSAIFLSAQVRNKGGISVKVISNEIGESEHTISKVLQQLARKKLVCSKTGPLGGFYLMQSQQHITLMDIVKEIDGIDIDAVCILGLSQCSSEKPCPLHHSFQPVKKKFTTLLKKSTLAQFEHDIYTHKTFLINNTRL